MLSRRNSAAATWTAGSTSLLPDPGSIAKTIERLSHNL